MPIPAPAPLPLRPAALLALAALSGCAASGSFYRPTRELAPAPDPARCRLEEVEFASGDGTALHGWFLSPLTGPVRGTVLHLHGNVRNLAHHARYVLPLVEAGFQVFTFDYRGYGRSEGEPSHEGVLEDALAALRLVQGRPERAGTRLVLFGQSLGGHLAPVVAARAGIRLDAVVLEGAFTGHRDIAAASSGAPRWLVELFVAAPFTALEQVARLQAPLLVIHGRDDQVVPPWMGERLWAAARAPKALWLVAGPHLGASVRETDEFVRRIEALLPAAP